MNFKELDLIEPILRALKEKNYKEPTSIQAKAIPVVLSGRDVMGLAQTGTGKTAAFVIPIIQRIHKIEGAKNGKPEIRALIVTPTRELAIQIDDNIKAYAKYTRVRNTVIFGGVKQGPQVTALRKGVHILVATPGRLHDLIEQGHVKPETVKILVLDEADRMLDMGFINDIKKLIRLIPKKRQSLFFSATMPANIVSLSKTILNDPKRIEAARISSAAETVQQFLYKTNKSLKKELLLHVLKDEDIEQVLVFSRTKRGADRIAKLLKRVNISASAIHGDKAQNARQRALKEFKAGKTRVLVATDIAARGIDIQKLKYVINYDIPNEPESYVHRIGRSGRAGEEGIAISFCEPEENAYVRDIEKLIKQKLKMVEDNPFPQTEKPMTEKEKKAFNKEKMERKRAFFENRSKKKNGQGKSAKRGGGQSKKKSFSSSKEGESKSKGSSGGRSGNRSNKKRSSWSKKKRTS